LLRCARNDNPSCSSGQTTSPSTSATILITANQLTRLILFQQECQGSDEAFKAHLLKTYKIKSRKLIPAAHFQAVLAWLANQRDARIAAEERAAIAEENVS
jgi:hypothetical protein